MYISEPLRKTYCVFSFVSFDNYHLFSIVRTTTTTTTTPPPTAATTPAATTTARSPNYFQAYVEDCQDVPSKYNYRSLSSLSLIVLDTSLNCYASNRATVENLIAAGYTSSPSSLLLTHFDQTAGSPTCGTQPSDPTVISQSIATACVNTLKNTVMTNTAAFNRIDGVLW